MATEDPHLPRVRHCGADVGLARWASLGGVEDPTGTRRAVAGEPQFASVRAASAPGVVGTRESAQSGRRVDAAVAFHDTDDTIIGCPRGTGDARRSIRCVVPREDQVLAIGRGRQLSFRGRRAAGEQSLLEAVDARR